ncbi:MAG: 6,7-dimethyl-8-ribityllumazine synthase [Phycisphaerales bacterium]|nr:6,7-dimethyl-8-ribityllumazine synthase [Phycisphaerales bacterium]
MAREIQGQLKAEGRRFALAVSRFNGFITDHLVVGAEDALKRHGCRDADITRVYVPGAFELPAAARKLAESGKFSAVIALGCVIRGQTPHFEYVAGEAVRGLGWVALHTGVPTAMGVLTCDTLEQAIDRAGGKAGNKGADAAMCALEMISVFEQIGRAE